MTDARAIVNAMSGTAKADALSLMLGSGRVLGNGVYRVVISVPGDKRLVAKIEDGWKSFHNIREWEAWLSVKDTAAAKWFAPCVDISPCGAVLLQRRTRVCTVDDIPKMPKRLPRAFDDGKVQNWGWLDGRVVCVDYSGACTRLALLKEMRTHKWWSYDPARTRHGSEAEQARKPTRKG